jgi:hypothetical protein
MFLTFNYPVEHSSFVYIHLLRLHNSHIMCTCSFFVHLSLHLHETEVRYLYNTAETLLIFTGIKYIVFTYTRLSIIYLYR